MKRTLGMLLAVVAGLLISPAAPAQAGEITMLDPSGDVYKYNPITQEEETQPGVTNVDVLRVKITHAPRKLHIKAMVVDITDPGEVIFFGEIKTPTTEWWISYQDETIGFDNLISGDYDCPTAYAVIDAEAEFVKVSIPRKCLQSPAWVRVQPSLWQEGVGNDCVGPLVWEPSTCQYGRKVYA